MGRPLLAGLALWGCSGDTESKPTGETGEPADTDTDTDADADADADTDTDLDTSATWSADVLPIVQTKCGGCHYDAAVPQGGFTIVDSTSIVGVPSTQLPSMPYVTAGDPEASYLWHKLDGTHLEVGGQQSAMPLTARLPDAELATIEGWIVGGAKP